MSQVHPKLGYNIGSFGTTSMGVSPIVRDLSGPLLCQLFECSLRNGSCSLADPEKEDVVCLSVEQPCGCLLVEVGVFTTSQ